jgi:hypothetical protein
MVDQAAAWDGFAACMARPHTRAMMGSTGSGGARPDGGRAPLEVRFARDSPLEGDGFEPSVPHKKQPFFATPVRSPQFAFHNKNRLFRARNRWFESISLQRRVRLSSESAFVGREPRLSARVCAAGLATWSAETRRVCRYRTKRRQYLCRAIFQYRSAADGGGESATPVPTESGLAGLNVDRSLNSDRTQTKPSTIC